ncbi:carboxypeptidase inhibitor SmCI-like [Mytilus californianus]|uniref:carboxypeptidase inhibitor SmCI-like n=1 Tax=Mytilus californianus TaxID=6549 RepID=UPI00224671C4|nr:carboxypeptidase inhibitor SmCI-like [Mytilus californianus]
MFSILVQTGVHGAQSGVAGTTIKKNEEKVCILKSVTGRCKASLTRYYYNWQTEQCEQFIYGGCGGNVVSVQAGIPLFEGLPENRGPCTARMERYYYSQKNRQCKKFVYGGCAGNANNFETLKACQNNCP